MFHDTVKEHVGFGLHDLADGDLRDTTIVHTIPLLALGALTTHVGNVVPGMGIFARVHNHGKQSTHNVGLFGLQVGRDILLQLQYLTKRNVSFNLGRSTTTGVHVVVAATGSGQ